MLRVAPGSIVAIASTRAHMSDPDTESYSASKGGLVALTHALAVSLGPEVMANVVSPGWIDVRGEALRPIHHAPHPAGRVGRVEDVTAMVAWLPVAGERLRDRGGVRGGWRITASTSPTSSGSSAAKARRVADHIKRVGAMAASSSQRQSNRRAPGRTSPAR
jgi:NAD(P)-dependent dehydrogenase (short-subunit alcohol dehydrogenase family)